MVQLNESIDSENFLGFTPYLEFPVNDPALEESRYLIARTTQIAEELMTLPFIPLQKEFT